MLISPEVTTKPYLIGVVLALVLAVFRSASALPRSLRSSSAVLDC
jgi:hypothetical protein